MVREQLGCPVLCVLRLRSHVRIDQGINFLSHVVRSTLSQVYVSHSTQFVRKAPSMHMTSFDYRVSSISDTVSLSKSSHEKQVYYHCFHSLPHRRVSNGVDFSLPHLVEKECPLQILLPLLPFSFRRRVGKVLPESVQSKFTTIASILLPSESVGKCLKQICYHCFHSVR